ncbi:MAG TPA: MBL fold metallo-hydrolase [Candidatus Dormibacteraeota bacterium]|nr:MBL fold metallo-hydrolase [Candidatus Dormibacteraeota bacterium]
MTIETFAVGRLGCNCTIICDDDSKTAIVVDGGDGVDDVMERLDARGLRATLLIHTHAHFDHIGDVGRLRDRTDAKALLHPGDLPLYRALPLQAKWAGMDRVPRVVDLDGDLRDGDSLNVGAARIDVHHTPGHTPGSVCFAVRDREGATVLLTGDTLFAGSIGRWDLGGTSMEDIVASIHAKLMDYPDATAVIPGHGNFTTIGIERSSNPYLQ